jgi:hypothetical protein
MKWLHNHYACCKTLVCRTAVSTAFCEKLYRCANQAQHPIFRHSDERSGQAMQNCAERDPKILELAHQACATCWNGTITVTPARLLTAVTMLACDSTPGRAILPTCVLIRCHSAANHTDLMHSEKAVHHTSTGHSKTETSESHTGPCISVRVTAD